MQDFASLSHPEKTGAFARSHAQHPDLAKDFDGTGCIMLIGFDTPFQTDIRAYAMALGLDVLCGPNAAMFEQPALIIACGTSFNTREAASVRHSVQRLFPNTPICILNESLLKTLSLPADLHIYDTPRKMLEATGFSFVSIVQEQENGHANSRNLSTQHAATPA